jgi:hypothetical protein
MLITRRIGVAAIVIALTCSITNPGSAQEPCGPVRDCAQKAVEAARQAITSVNALVQRLNALQVKIEAQNAFIWLGCNHVFFTRVEITVE